MRTVRSLLVIVITAVLLSGCSSTSQFKDINVTTEADPKTDLSGYATYEWAAAAALISDPDRKWTPADLDIGAAIRFAVDRELRSKGLTEVVSAPDMLAIYAVGVDMKALNVEIDEHNVQRFEEVPKGGILIVLVDTETRRAIWAGSAVAELLDEPDRDLTQQRIDYAITKMFDDFPG